MHRIKDELQAIARRLVEIANGIGAKAETKPRKRVRWSDVQRQKRSQRNGVHVAAPS